MRKNRRHISTAAPAALYDLHGTRICDLYDMVDRLRSDFYPSTLPDGPHTFVVGLDLSFEINSNYLRHILFYQLQHLFAYL